MSPVHSTRRLHGLLTAGDVSALSLVTSAASYYTSNVRISPLYSLMRSQCRNITQEKYTFLYLFPSISANRS
ncbi:hypothetical protein GDO81_021179 [Engystomops pustulosus]|uniref:Uncharacterized protein n=1 Tax=Engystomops pustulosus TaxID=76066 RepID=A0AAV6ZCX4_ENGPU|nr:hypothetical protein GDO81_021179 [Engystomops pustulosus]